MQNIELGRSFMKSNFVTEEFTSDQLENKPQPELSKTVSEPLDTIVLPEVTMDVLRKSNILDLLEDRVSHRSFLKEEISLEELSFLLWSTQGVKSVKGENYATMRRVPSAGARHPYETYLVVNWVQGVKPGIYQYLPLQNSIVLIKVIDDQIGAFIEAAKKQKFAGNCAVNFIWTCVPYRGEWRYSSRSHKPMLLDAGHICQNLYLACEAIGCGTCAIAAYDQGIVDQLLGVDGENEYTVYMSPVGRVKNG